MRGAVLGTVVLAKVVRDASSPWAIDGQWHWVLDEPYAFADPIPCVGARGIWALPPMVQTVMRDQRLQAECSRLGQ